MGDEGEQKEGHQEGKPGENLHQCRRVEQASFWDGAAQPESGRA